MGTLLSLDGRQRLVFILAELFGASDEIGAEVVGVAPANFRQILSRACRDLYEDLAATAAWSTPRIAASVRKTRAFIEGGFVDPQKLEFKAGYRRHVRETAETRADKWREAYEKVAANLYRDHPFYERAEQASILRTALAWVSLDATK